MGDNFTMEQEEIFSKVMRAGRRTYFFDVRSTKAGDFYLTITESKKFTNDDGSFHYKKHKIYLYKEDFEEFRSTLDEMTNYVIDEKGEEVISERHQRNYNREDAYPNPEISNGQSAAAEFTNIDFDDI